MQISVTNDTSVSRSNELVSNGFPFPRDLHIKDVSNLGLRDQDGNYFPAQFQAVAWWPEGTVKWVLISFVTSIAPGETQVFNLEINSDRPTPNLPDLGQVDSNGNIIIDTGKLRFRVPRDGSKIIDKISLKIGSNWQMLEMADSINFKLDTIADSLYLGPTERITIEDNGTQRIVLHLEGYYLDNDQKTDLAYKLEIIAHRNSATLSIDHTLRNHGEPVKLKGLDFIMPVAVNQLDIWHGKDQISTQEIHSDQDLIGILQDDSDSFNLGKLNDSTQTKVNGQFAGWVTASSNSNWSISATIRHFWQKYPKSLGATSEQLAIGLLPSCSKNWDSFLPGNQSKNCYELLLGESRSHQFMFCFHESWLDNTEIEAVMEQCHYPLLHLAPWDWYCQSKALGDLARQDKSRYQEYEEAIEADFADFLLKRQNLKLYGDRNFGDDSYGKLGSWNNCEYDYPHVGMLMFLRGGGRKWYDHFVLPAARHMIDIDIINAGPQKGMVYQHDNQYAPEILGHSSAGTGKLGSHAWIQGILEYFAFSGDYLARDVALTVADRWADQTISQYNQIEKGIIPAARMYGTERQWGWTNVAIMGAYNLVPDQKYLQAATALFEVALELQTDTGLFSGFFERHIFAGMLMGSPIMDSIVSYYQATQDQRAKEMITKAGRAFSNYGWIEPPGAWAYHAGHGDYRTSSDRNLAPAVGYAYHYSDTPEHDSILWERAVKGFKRSWGERTQAGKGLTQSHRFALRMLALMNYYHK